MGMFSGRAPEEAIERSRSAILRYATTDLASGKISERVYLAALLVEQMRTNDLLERLIDRQGG